MHNKRAFTLIETLLAMTIFAFIGLGIAMSFFSGIKLWDRATTSGLWINDMVLNFETVSKELRQSLDVPAIGFEGDIKSFSFPGLSGNKIVKVSYSFDAAAKAIKRSETMIKDIIEEKMKVESVEKNAFPLDEFSAQYLKMDKDSKSLEWKDEWKKEDGIFIAVRFKGKSHNEEFQKTIFIPIAQ
ncbi:MAG: type II secretion system protein [Candidatus Omnitrophota bacterium]|nr:type II secretion system protein [Candidatus Omnitrophota bacterium]